MLEEKKIWEWLEDTEKRLKLLHESCERCMPTEELQEKIQIIETIKKRLKVLNIIQDYAIKYENCVCIVSLFYEKEIMEWCI